MSDTPDFERDEALRRLRDADPARDLRPDLDALRSAVAARIAADDGAARVPDELAQRRARRTGLIAAVAASAVVMGGLGFGLGRLGGTPGVAPAGGVIVLGYGTASGDAASASGAEPAVGAPAVAEGSGTAAADARIGIWPPFPWRTVFTAEGLSDATTRARAWTFDARSAFTAEAAERAAAALGLSGAASQQYGSWVVGVQDGTGPSLTLAPDGYTSFSFYDPTRDPYSCLKSQDAAAGLDGRVRCARDDFGPAPRGADAARAMRDLLARLGIQASVEIETSEYNVPEFGAPQMTSVLAYQVLDGSRTGVTWSATFVGDGVQNAYGPLAPVISLGEYDVVSENDAVGRLNDPRFGATWGGVLPLAEDAVRSDAAGAAEGASGAGAAGSAGDDTATVVEPDAGVAYPAPDGTPTVPATPEPGDPIAWPVQHVTITGARLGLTMQWLPDGAVVLAPAYELTDDDGGSWSVIAVAESGLDFEVRQN